MSEYYDFPEAPDDEFISPADAVRELDGPRKASTKSTGGSTSSGPTDGDTTQHMLLSYMAGNPEIWIRCAPVIDEAYFDGKYKPVVETLQTFEQKHQVMPSIQVIQADTGIRLETPEDCKDESVVQAICDRVEEFCRNEAAINFLIASADVITEDQTRGTLAALVGEMDRIANISVRQDLGFEVYEDAERLLSVAEDMDGQPTGFCFLDDVLNGGVTNPSFNLVSADSGQGKSIFLANQAVKYSRQGYNVIYISLELPEFMIEKRFAAMLTNTDINALYEDRSDVLRKIGNQQKQNGKIQVKRFSMSGTTVADIRAFVRELTSATGLVWSHIMIDYMDLMTPMNADIKADNIHGRDQAIAVELYDWTHEKGSTKIVWSASQQTKGAQEEKTARSSNVAGGTGKVNTCDVLIVFKRTLEDIQSEQTICFVVKGRNGGTGQKIPFFWDGKTMLMDNIPEHQDFFRELNSPQSEERNKFQNKMRNDPISKERAGMGMDKTTSERKASHVRDTIMKRMKTGKVVTS